MHVVIKRQLYISDCIRACPCGWVLHYAVLGISLYRAAWVRMLCLVD